METARKIIETISWIVTIVTAIESIVKSFTKEQIAITVIVLLIIIYLTVLIFFYNESKKNHSYGSKSDSDIK